MRPATAEIVVVDQSALPSEWRRFTAALCLMSFYTVLVRAAHVFWTKGLLEWHRGQPDRWFFTSMAGVGFAAAMYVCGRSLWRSNRWARAWTLVAIIAIAASAGVNLGYQSYFKYGEPISQDFLFANAEIGFAMAPALQLPFVAVLATSTWIAGRRHPPKRLPGWVVLASVWSVFQLIPFLLDFDVRNRIGCHFHTLWGYYVALGSMLALPAGLSFMLLLGVSWARWVAWIVAATFIAPSLLYSYALSRLIADALGALMSSLPGRVLEWSPFPMGCCLLNRHFFMTVFVDLVLQAGPWILIAIYARKYPMRIPPDDGSPFPRFYCGHCGYNLHGIAHDVCPECGRPLR